MYIIIVAFKNNENNQFFQQFFLLSSNFGDYLCELSIIFLECEFGDSIVVFPLSINFREITNKYVRM